MRLRYERAENRRVNSGRKEGAQWYRASIDNLSPAHRMFRKLHFTSRFRYDFLWLDLSLLYIWAMTIPSEYVCMQLSERIENIVRGLNGKLHYLNWIRCSSYKLFYPPFPLYTCESVILMWLSCEVHAGLFWCCNFAIFERHKQIRKLDNWLKSLIISKMEHWELITQI